MGVHRGYEETSMELEALKLKNRQEKESRALSLEELENTLQETRDAYGNAEVTAPCDGVVQYMEESVKVGAAAKKDTLAAYISDASQAAVLCPRNFFHILFIVENSNNSPRIRDRVFIFWVISKIPRRPRNRSDRRMQRRP